MVQWRDMVSWALVDIGSGNGLLHDGTKPLSELMLAYHQEWGIGRGGDDEMWASFITMIYVIADYICWYNKSPITSMVL